MKEERECWFLNSKERGKKKLRKSRKINMKFFVK